MFRAFLLSTALGLSFFSLHSQAASCSITEANWEINVKGNDPTVKALIGDPVTDITLVPGADGCFRHHQRGSIYWNQQAGAHFVMGAIRGKWSALGWERGFLRYPITDETATPDRVGRFNHFQGGSIYWHPSLGAYEVHGDIRALWSTIGWELSVLGYPKSDELVLADSKGRASHFQRGSIYWKPNLGPHYVMGSISYYYETHGHETNPNLGYPITHELPATPESANRFSDFENGVIYWKAGTGVVSELGAFPLASRPKEDLEVAAQAQVAALMAPHASEAYVDRQPTITAVTDYARTGLNTVINREIQIDLRVKYKAEFLGIDGLLPDPYTDLTLWASFHPQGTAAGTDIVMTLTRARMRTTVPSPTNAVISPEAINQKLKDEVLKDVIGKPMAQGTLPPSVKVLSVKVMPNADLRTFIEPL